jgi:hypothetical protein
MRKGVFSVRLAALFFDQELDVYDNYGHGSPLFAVSTSWSRENAGSPC